MRPPERAADLGGACVEPLTSNPPRKRSAEKAALAAVFALVELRLSLQRSVLPRTGSLGTHSIRLKRHRVILARRE